MKKIPFLDLYSQYLSIKPSLERVIQKVIKNSGFVKGEYVSEFERNFAEYLGISHCVGVGNGTDALEISFQALGLPQGSEIIVPANSFAATAEAVVRAGCKPVFCDCDKSNYTLDLDHLEKKINSKTSAVVPVHLYGHPCDMGRLLKITQKRKIQVIEDAAQAHGAEYKGKKVGGFGRLGIFSFYPGKVLGAYGDGGAIVTDNKELARKCRMIANHGRVSKHDYRMIGRNSRLDGLQAGVLNVKLNHLEEWIKKRNKIAALYLSKLKNCEQVVLPRTEEWARNVYHLFVIRAKKRDDLKSFLKEKGIETGIHYPKSIPELKPYRRFVSKKEKFFTSKISKELLSLPMGEHLSEKEAGFVADSIKEFYSK